MKIHTGILAIFACFLILVAIGVEIYVHGINQEVKDSFLVNSASERYAKAQKDIEELENKQQELQMEISHLEKRRNQEQYVLGIYKETMAEQCYWALDKFMQQNDGVDVRYNEIVRCINNYYEHFDDYQDRYTNNDRMIQILNNYLIRYGDDKEMAVEAVYNEIKIYTD